jgi:diguanylate cyclase (GGDEF)-like protein
MTRKPTPTVAFLLLAVAALGVLAFLPQALDFRTFVALFLSAALLIALWADRRTRRRLARLAAVAEAITEGDFSQRIRETGSDSIGSVSTSLNRMAEHVQRSIEQLREGEEHVRQLAYNDPLTGLPNRRLFHDLLERELSAAKRYGYEMAIAIFDVDHLKDVNDSLGHLAGDHLLAELAVRLKSRLRSSDVIARLAGDEFALIMRTAGKRDEALKAIQRLLRACRDPIDLDSREILTTISAGICFFPGDGDDSTTLMKNADFALYQAKQEGRNKLLLFNESMNELANERLELEQDLRRALDNDEFRLFWQAQVSLADGGIVGMEGLCRWLHPEKGIIMPLTFIPVAEEAGLMPQLGYRVLLEACRRAAMWRDRGFPHIPVSVNVSVRQLQAGDFPEIVERVLLLTDLEPSLLELEITESIAAEGEGILPHIARLRDLGVGLAIDDFGTGYSSFSYLLKHRIDTIKIDRSFVIGLPSHKDSVAIVRAIVSMARNLGLDVVAEGVDTQEQLDFLYACGCGVAQGFLLHMPMPWREMEPLLKEGRLPLDIPEDRGAVRAIRVLR